MDHPGQRCGTRWFSLSLRDAAGATRRVDVSEDASIPLGPAGGPRLVGGVRNRPAIVGAGAVIRRTGRSCTTGDAPVVLLHRDVLEMASGRWEISFYGTWQLRHGGTARAHRTGFAAAATLAAFLGLTPARAAAETPDETAAEVEGAADEIRSQRQRHAEHVPTRERTAEPGTGRIVGSVGDAAERHAWLGERGPITVGLDRLGLRAEVARDGSYVLDGVPAGGQLLLVKAGELVVAQMAVDVQMDAETRADFALPDPMIFFRPLAGVIQLPPEELIDPWPRQLVVQPLGPPRGMALARIDVLSDVGDGHHGRPLRVAPALVHGFTDVLSLGLRTGDGFCLDGRSACGGAVLDRLEADLTATSPYRHHRQLGVRLGAGLESFDPARAYVLAGLLGKLTAKPVALVLQPEVLIGVKGRDASNPDRLRAVAELQVQLAHDWATHVQGRLELPFTAPGSTMLGARLGVSYQTIVGIELRLPHALGSGATVSERSVVLYLQLPWPTGRHTLPPA